MGGCSFAYTGSARDNASNSPEPCCLQHPDLQMLIRAHRSGRVAAGSDRGRCRSLDSEGMPRDLVRDKLLRKRSYPLRYVAVDKWDDTFKRDRRGGLAFDKGSTCIFLPTRLVAVKGR